MTLEQTIAAMMTENTGTHMLDSGGACGRNWQRNAGATIDDFRARPSATLEIDIREFGGGKYVDLMPTVDIFHKLTSGVIELDELCREYNARAVDDWGSDLNGVSHSNEEWLQAMGFEWDDRECGFNTYNWDNNFSQVLQGNFITRETEYGSEKYVLLQIHGGADVRGGYTDAKLFKLDDHAEEYDLLRDDCGFSVEYDDGEYLELSWHGEWIEDGEFGGCLMGDDDAALFAKHAGATVGNSVKLSGDAYNDF